MFLLGGGEEAIEESVTVTMVYIEPSVGQPTQDSTKDFTPRMDTDPVREKSGKSIPRKPFTTKVRCHLCLCHRTFIAPDKSLDDDVAVGLKVGGIGSCGIGGKVGRIPIRGSVDRFPAPTIHVLKYPWATESRVAPNATLECEYVCEC